MALKLVSINPDRSDDLLDAAWIAVSALAKRFHSNKRHYFSDRYKEVDVRADFIDKLFYALGWQRSDDPFRQEMKIEQGSKASKGRADYAFSIGPHYSRVRFYVEAKRPQPSIATPDNCFQAIRYSWPREIPITVLTDFGSIHVLDCRFRPSIDSATRRIVRSWKYSDLEVKERFAELYWLFSREAIESGSIENFAANELPAKQVATKLYSLSLGEVRDFDEDFLQRLDNWRELLAVSFKRAAVSLTGEQLTECVQRTLDRLVFISFLEDKGIEGEQIISKFGQEKRSHWRDFVSATSRLDPIYNGVVFKHHSILDTPDFNPVGDAFEEVCDELTDHHTPYNFEAIPVEILGRIYERFLGKIVQTKLNTVEVVEKEDVRKAGGVYYTPGYIVNYIVSNSLKLQLKDKKPDDIMKLRVIDTSCGSGSFLIGAFDALLEAALSYFRSRPKEAKKGILETRDRVLHLSLKYRREILVNCIYGVDIDQQAVEVAQLSLYLKLMENETPHSAKQQQIEMGIALLPSLNANVVVGNSLVTLDDTNGDMMEEERLAEIKSLNFKKTFRKVFRDGGFDVVLGNPPYIKEYTNRVAFNFLRDSPYYLGKMDIWYMFACRGLDWLKPETGVLAFIATNNWVTNSGAKKLREKVTSSSKITQLIDFGDFKVFRDAAIQTMILIAQKSEQSEPYSFDYRRLSGPDLSLDDAQAILARAERANSQYLTPSMPLKGGGDGLLTFSESNIEIVLDKILSRRNFELDGREEVAQGIVPNPDVVSARSIQLIPRTRRQRHEISVGDGVFVVDKNTFEYPDPEETGLLKPVYEPTDVSRYFILRPPTKMMIYSTHAAVRKSSMPRRLLQHLEKFKEIMEERRENKNGRISFFHLHWARDSRFFTKGPKILSVRKCAVPTFAYVEDEAFVMMAFNIIKTDRANLLYLTGLLNSRVINFWLKHRGKIQGQNYQIDKEPLLAIPLLVPTKLEQESVAALVKRIIRLSKQVAMARTDSERVRLSREIEVDDEEVQELIGQFYGLTEDDRNLVGY